MIRLNKFFHNSFKGIFFFLLFFSLHLFGQSITRLEVITAIGSNYISAQSKEGMIYFSISQFADALSENYQGKTIKDLDVRNKTGASIIGLKDATGKYIVNPSPDYVIKPLTKLIILGDPEQINNFKSFMTN